MIGRLQIPPALIATDIDGTIARSDHRLSRHTEQVLARLWRAGTHVVLITGRHEHSASATARSLGLGSPVISCNGAVVTDPVSGERLWVSYMEDAQVQASLAFARAHDLTIELWGLDDRYVECLTPPTELLDEILEHKAIVGPLDEVVGSTPLVKVMIGGEPSRLDPLADALKNSVPGMERSMAEFFEAAPIGATKQEALAFVLDALGIAPEDCWGFGDGGNDKGWMSMLGTSFAPANARDSVKEIATEVIEDNNNDGPARHLEQSLLT